MHDSTNLYRVVPGTNSKGRKFHNLWIVMAVAMRRRRWFEDDNDLRARFNYITRLAHKKKGEEFTRQLSDRMYEVEQESLDQMENVAKILIRSTEDLYIRRMLATVIRAYRAGAAGQVEKGRQLALQVGEMWREKLIRPTNKPGTKASKQEND